MSTPATPTQDAVKFKLIQVRCVRQVAVKNGKRKRSHVRGRPPRCKGFVGEGNEHCLPELSTHLFFSPRYVRPEEVVQEWMLNGGKIVAPHPFLPSI